MYSILLLGLVMLAHGFGVHIPEWFSPLATLLIVGSALFVSWKRRTRCVKVRR
jgi:hypothetical protein